MSQETLQSQIEILEKILATTPEKIGVKFNPHWFALKNKIKNLKVKKSILVQHNFLAR